MPTFPSAFPVLRIDHCFVSRSVAVTRVQARPRSGAVTLSWPDAGLGVRYQVYVMVPGAAGYVEHVALQYRWLRRLAGPDTAVFEDMRELPGLLDQG